MQTTHILINGDCRKMSLIQNESVHLIVTSPPYWQLKDYGSSNQIGFNDTYKTTHQYISGEDSPFKRFYRNKLILSCTLSPSTYINPTTSNGKNKFCSTLLQKTKPSKMHSNCQILHIGLWI